MRIWELFIGFNKEEFGYECMDRVGCNPVHTYLGDFIFDRTSRHWDFLA